MKSSSALLADLLDKVKEAGQGSIRRSLVHKVTHHILSQDLEDAVNSDGDSDKYVYRLVLDSCLFKIFFAPVFLS
jgi:hypothetical protein